jgi:hypothetical protein
MLILALLVGSIVMVVCSGLLWLIPTKRKAPLHWKPLRRVASADTNTSIRSVASVWQVGRPTNLGSGNDSSVGSRSYAVGLSSYCPDPKGISRDGAPPGRNELIKSSIITGRIGGYIAGLKRACMSK